MCSVLCHLNLIITSELNKINLIIISKYYFHHSQNEESEFQKSQVTYTTQKLLIIAKEWDLNVVIW